MQLDMFGDIGWEMMADDPRLIPSILRRSYNGREQNLSWDIDIVAIYVRGVQLTSLTF